MCQADAKTVKGKGRNVPFRTPAFVSCGATTTVPLAPGFKQVFSPYYQNDSLNIPDSYELEFEIKPFQFYSLNQSIYHPPRV